MIHKHTASTQFHADDTYLFSAELQIKQAKTSQHAQWRSLTHTEAFVHPVEQLLGVFGPGFSVEEGRLHAALAALQNAVQLQHPHGGGGT